MKEIDCIQPNYAPSCRCPSAAYEIHPSRVLRDSTSELQYLFRFRGRSDEEGHLRSLLVGMTAGNTLALHSLTSEDIDGTGVVEVRADLLSSGRQDAALEQIVNRLSLEPSVTAVSWELAPQTRYNE